MYLSDLKNRLIIDDSNYHQFINEVDENGNDRLKGYNPRDYGAAPFGSFADAFPRQFYIDSSEWRDRIEYLDKTKGQCKDHKDLAGFDSLDQNGTNYCTTEDSEVLTEKGWVAWPDYNGKDLLATVNPITHNMEFQQPLSLQTFEHNGEMIYSENRSIDFAVTPNHRMYVRKWNEKNRKLNNKYDFILAKDLGWYFGMMASPVGYMGTKISSVEIEGDKIYNGDDFVQLISLVLSDGYAGGSEKTKNWVSFSCFKAGDRLDYIRSLAKRLGFTEKTSNPGVFIRYNAAKLAEWIRQNCYINANYGPNNKKVPGIFKFLCQSQIEKFLDIYGDKSHTRNNHYFSTSKLLIDDIQELFLRIGKRSSIWKAETRPDSYIGDLKISPKHPIWHLHMRSSDQLSICKKSQVHSDHYKGLVYCATVPNSTLITRRNNSVLISGNCWINAPIQACHYIRSMQGLPHIPLSPASVGAKIKNFRNVGGWGSEGLAYLNKYGAVPQSMWPANAIDRRYDTDENNDQRKKYRVNEFYELPDRSFHALVSALLLGWPVAIGLNWWRHEVLACKVLIRGNDPESDTVIDIDNSWGTNWGDNGHGILTRSKATPDEAVCVRTMIPSV